MPKGSCTLTASVNVAGKTITGSAQITISKNSLRIATPNNNSFWVIQQSPGSYLMSGTVSAVDSASSISLAGGPSGPAVGGAPNGSLIPWTSNWTGLTPGTYNIGASVTFTDATSLSASVSNFWVFGPPPAPALTCSGAVFYSGDDVTITAAAADNSANPSPP